VFVAEILISLAETMVSYGFLCCGIPEKPPWDIGHPR